MAEVKYESKVVSNASSIGAIYQACSNLQNLEKLKETIPHNDRISELEFQPDFIRFKVDGLGQKIGIRIIAKEENDYVKFGIENAPVDGNFWIQLKAAGQQETKLRLTVKVDLPTMFKMMVGGKIQSALDQAADMFAKIPFEQLNRE